MNKQGLLLVNQEENQQYVLGSAYKVSINPDKTTIKADGADTTQIRVTLVPNYEGEIEDLINITLNLGNQNLISMCLSQANPSQVAEFKSQQAGEFNIKIVENTVESNTVQVTAIGTTMTPAAYEAMQKQIDDLTIALASSLGGA